MKINMFSSKSKLFFRFSLTLTISIVLTILIVSTVLYLNFENIILNNLYKSNNERLTQINSNTNYLIENAKTLLMQTYSDNDTYKLMIFPHLDFDDINNGINKLNLYIAVSPYIHSFYIINNSNNTVFTSLVHNAIQNSNNFFDKDILKIISNRTDYIDFYPIPRKISEKSEIIGNRSYPVYTFVLRGFNNSNNSNDAIVINLSQNLLTDLIKKFDKNTNSQTFVIDNKGFLVTSTPKYDMLTTLKNNDYIKKALNSENKSGWFISDVSGVTSLVTYMSSDTLNWKFISVIPYQNIISQINSLKNLTIIIAIIILLLGIVFSYLLSKFMYTPVKDIVDKLRILEIDKNKNTAYLKQKFLNKLLIDQFLNTNYINENLNYYEISFKPQEGIIILYFGIDKYVDFKNKYNSEDISLFKYGIMNIISEFISELGITEIVDLQEANIVAILNPKNKIDDTFYQNLRKEITSIFKATDDYINISLSVAISDVFYELNHISEAYISTINIYKYKLYKGYNSIFDNSDILSYKIEEVIYNKEKEKILVESLLARKLEDCIKHFNDLIELYKNKNIEGFNISIFNIALSINMAILKIVENFETPFYYNFGGFISQISSLETLDEIKVHFDKMFAEIINSLERRTTLKHGVLVKNAIGIIENKYKDTNLSLDSISADFHLSSAYFGRLFKNQTQKSMSDYINMVRLEKASELLINTSIQINDVVKNIGFLSYSYFYTIFKKTYGMTPNEYRQTYLSKRISEHKDKI